jgi:hypothetical protein
VVVVALQGTGVTVVQMTAKGGLGNDAGDFARSQGNGRKWLIGDYQAGDVSLAKDMYSYM